MALCARAALLLLLGALQVLALPGAAADGRSAERKRAGAACVSMSGVLVESSTHLP